MSNGSDAAVNEVPVEAGLSPIAMQLITAAANGQVLDLRGSDAATLPEPIEADVLYALCVGTRADWPVHARGVHVIGARFRGELNFTGATLRTILVLEHCVLDDGMSADRATARFLSLRGSAVKFLNAADLTCTQSADFSELQCPGTIDLRGANISGFFSLAAGRLGDGSGGDVVQATGLTVGHDVDFRRLDARGPLRLDRSKLTGDLDCTAASFNSGARDQPAMSMAGASIGGNVVISDARSLGALVLTGATIGGGFIAASAELALRTDEAARQLGADGMHHLHLLAARTESEKTDAIIDHLQTSGGPPTSAPAAEPPAAPPAVESRAVLNLQGAHIGGAVRLTDRFRAEGEVNLLSASITLGIECSEAIFINRATDGSRPRPALNAQGLYVAGNFLLQNACVCMGQVSLLGASIGGELHCDDARLWNPDGIALLGVSLNVGGTLAIHEGSTIEGTTDLSGADVDGDLDCRGANFDIAKGTAFSMQGARVRGTFFWGPFGIKPSSTTDYFMFGDFQLLYADPPTGTVDFTGARVGFLVDDNSAWKGDPDLKLEGFVYDLLGEGAAHYSWRVNWLARQARRRPQIDTRTRKALNQALTNLPPMDYGHYSPQVFEQLATVYDRMGSEGTARAIRIAKQRAARDAGHLSWGERFSNRLLDITIRYGWEPWRIVVFGLLVVVFGTLVFASLGESSFAPTHTSGTQAYAAFNPLAYSLDVFIPIIHLGQASEWAPRDNVQWWPFGLRTTGAIVQGYLWIHIILGWMVSTLAVAAFTGLVRRGS